MILPPLPIVTNRHHYKHEPIPEPQRYIGRSTPLGNPYTVQEHGMGALDRYRRWLWGHMKRESPQIMSALRSIQPGERLVCSCAPRPCHGDVVVKAWAWLLERDLAALGMRDGDVRGSPRGCPNCKGSRRMFMPQDYEDMTPETCVFFHRACPSCNDQGCAEERARIIDGVTGAHPPHELIASNDRLSCAGEIGWCA